MWTWCDAVFTYMKTASHWKQKKGEKFLLEQLVPCWFSINNGVWRFRADFIFFFFISIHFACMLQCHCLYLNCSDQFFPTLLFLPCALLFCFPPQSNRVIYHAISRSHQSLFPHLHLYLKLGGLPSGSHPLFFSVCSVILTTISYLAQTTLCISSRMII